MTKSSLKSAKNELPWNGRPNEINWRKLFIEKPICGFQKEIEYITITPTTDLIITEIVKLVRPYPRSAKTITEL